MNHLNSDGSRFDHFSYSPQPEKPKTNNQFDPRTTTFNTSINISKQNNYENKFFQTTPTYQNNFTNNKHPDRSHDQASKTLTNRANIQNQINQNQVNQISIQKNEEKLPKGIKIFENSPNTQQKFNKIEKTNLNQSVGTLQKKQNTYNPNSSPSYSSWGTKDDYLEKNGHRNYNPLIAKPRISDFSPSSTHPDFYAKIDYNLDKKGVSNYGTLMNKPRTSDFNPSSTNPGWNAKSENSIEKAEIANYGGRITKQRTSDFNPSSTNSGWNAKSENIIENAEITNYGGRISKPRTSDFNPSSTQPIWNNSNTNNFGAENYFSSNNFDTKKKSFDFEAPTNYAQSNTKFIKKDPQQLYQNDNKMQNYVTIHEESSKMKITNELNEKKNLISHTSPWGYEQMFDKEKISNLQINNQDFATPPLSPTLQKATGFKLGVPQKKEEFISPKPSNTKPILKKGKFSNPKSNHNMNSNDKKNQFRVAFKPALAEINEVQKISGFLKSGQFDGEKDPPICQVTDCKVFQKQWRNKKKKAISEMNQFKAQSNATRIFLINFFQVYLDHFFFLIFKLLKISC